MSSADRSETTAIFAYWLQDWPRRYGFALMMVAVATLLRFALTEVIGANLLFSCFTPQSCWSPGWRDWRQPSSL
jgi:hypothetical protein